MNIKPLSEKEKIASQVGIGLSTLGGIGLAVYLALGDNNGKVNDVLDDFQANDGVISCDILDSTPLDTQKNTVLPIKNRATGEIIYFVLGSCDTILKD